MTEITSEAQLRELLGEPLPRVAGKARPGLHDYDKQWLARSPLCLVATSGADGSCDVSPKGDPPGFTLVLDDTTIAIPERPGNRRADGFRNILTNPHVGLIYLVPGREDTLRINGAARLVSDAPFFDQMQVKGHRPLLALVVAIDQVFYHCAKAFLRANLWQPATWNADAVPSRAQIAQRIERPHDALEDLERYYGPAYANRLYETG
ncbi:MAG: pyridoxamine 5'-phosphate oxidase family protein [Pseudonocardiaceae bacterium]